MKTLAIYAGSFNPFHVGHLNIVNKTEDIFGQGNVIIAKGINPEKVQIPIKGFMYNVPVSVQTGSDLLEKEIGIPVMDYTGYLHEFIQTLEGKTGFRYVLVRGLRNGDDLSYEENQLKFMKHFKPDLKVAFILCDPKFNHISSSAIRNMNKVREGSGNEFIVGGIRSIND